MYSHQTITMNENAEHDQRCDYLARLRTFTPSWWFGKPIALSAIHAARKGWYCVARDIIKCETCQARLIVSMEGGMLDRRTSKALDVFAEKLVNAHCKQCKWRTEQTTAVVAMPPITEAAIVDDLKRRCQRIRKAPKLPKLHTSFINDVNKMKKTMENDHVEGDTHKRQKSLDAPAMLAVTGWDWDGKALFCAWCANTFGVQYGSTKRTHTEDSTMSSVKHMRLSFDNYSPASKKHTKDTNLAAPTQTIPQFDGGGDDSHSDSNSSGDEHAYNEIETIDLVDSDTAEDDSHPEHTVQANLSWSDDESDDEICNDEEAHSSDYSQSGVESEEDEAKSKDETSSGSTGRHFSSDSAELCQSNVTRRISRDRCVSGSHDVLEVCPRYDDKLNMTDSDSDDDKSGQNSASDFFDDARESNTTVGATAEVCLESALQPLSENQDAQHITADYNIQSTNQSEEANSLRSNITPILYQAGPFGMVDFNIWRNWDPDHAHQLLHAPPSATISIKLPSLSLPVDSCVYTPSVDVCLSNKRAREEDNITAPAADDNIVDGTITKKQRTTANSIEKVGIDKEDNSCIEQQLMYTPASSASESDSNALRTPRNQSTFSNSHTPTSLEPILRALSSTNTGFHGIRNHRAFCPIINPALTLDIQKDSENATELVWVRALRFYLLSPLTQ